MRLYSYDKPENNQKPISNLWFENKAGYVDFVFANQNYINQNLVFLSRLPVRFRSRF